MSSRTSRAKTGWLANEEGSIYGHRAKLSIAVVRWKLLAYVDEIGDDY